MLNPTFTATDPVLGRVSFRDRKRWLWALSVLYPLIPFTGIAGHWLSGNPLWLVLPDAKITLVNDVPTASGDIYIVQGPIGSARFDPSRVVTTKVGTASLAFVSRTEARLTSTIFGRSETRAIGRQPF